jgi:hypothetical protein
MEIPTMKRIKGQKDNNPTQLKDRDHHVSLRLDQAIPLQTEEWQKVEQSLMRMTEFAPESMIEEVVSALASYADDQARRGYLLGQEDLVKELARRPRVA